MGKRYEGDEDEEKDDERKADERVSPLQGRQETRCNRDV